ncbi:MAG: hypothetical protein FJZ90_13000 [Chloroflexi bacterium]|nr:hypothetical protein [Chloroflexota bacterium]
MTPRCTARRSNVIVNTGAVVGHDCVIGDHAHIGPGAILCGEVVIGAESFVAASATIVPTRRVGARTVIAAGAVVVKDIPDDALAMGVPARCVVHRE